ncbi:hypothetical protein [Flavobacterium adhaerens]|uniref:hypothetical protein n=1 Tax=Flavobacterium adhaerens TaxID=3149043 RepID=UPI0032B3CE81
MIAYDKTLLDNTYIYKTAHKLKKSGFISLEQYKLLDYQLPKLKTQDNIFFRIGFFILGTILYTSINSFLSFFGVVILEEIGLDYNQYIHFLFLLALIGFAIKEIMASKMGYFGFGVDDAFILGAIGLLLTNIGISFEHNNETNYLLIFIVMAIVSTITYLRYLNLILALLACIGLTASIAFFVFENLIIGQSILPFVLMLFAFVSYFLCSKKLENLNLPYYFRGLKLAKGYFLILSYLAGNYYVVRELNASLSGEVESKEIPFSLLFWGFTFIIPVLYLVFSVKNKDRMMLWIGFLCLSFSFFSFRNYYHVLPAEFALTLGGLALFAFTYVAIKKTKHNETGITFKADKLTDPNAFANLQVLVTATQFGLKPEVPVEDSPIKFGGGGFSGGGSSGDF